LSGAEFPLRDTGILFYAEISPMTTHALDAFPVIRTQDPEAMRNALLETFGASSFNLLGSNRKFQAKANHRQLKILGISLCSYGAPVELSFPATSYFRQQICLTGAGETKASGKAVEVTREISCITQGDRESTLSFGGDYEQLVLRVDAAPLIAKLEALVGRSIKTLEFEMSSPVHRRETESFLRLFSYLVNEIGRPDCALPDLAIQEVEQALAVSFLFANPHNLSSELTQDIRTPARWQVRLAEEYIRENWNKPITIESLVSFVGCSARSLFKGFRESRGCSPMDVVKQVRLEHAQRMLSEARPGTSITGVAYACGFHNAGHFARYYRNRFGELPSETLRRLG